MTSVPFLVFLSLGAGISLYNREVDGSWFLVFLLPAIILARFRGRGLSVLLMLVLAAWFWSDALYRLDEGHGFGTGWREFEAKVVSTGDPTVVAAKGARLAIRGSAGSLPEMKAGDRVSIRAFVERPRGPGNPGSYDGRSHLLSQRVHYQTWVSGPGQVRVVGRGHPMLPTRLAEGLRDHIRARLEAALPARLAGLAASLVLGDRSGLDPSDEAAFRRAGVMHVLAVSGMHVGILAASAFLLLGLGGLPRERALLPVGLLIAAYALLTGGRSSVLRASLMSFMALWGHCSGKKKGGLGALFTAGSIILISNPFRWLDIGFRLSFAATFGILLLYRPYEKLLAFLPGPVRSLLSLTLAAQTGSLPLLLYYFQSFSVGGLLGNLLITPAAAPAMSLSLLLGLVPFGEFLLAWPVALCLKWMTFWAVMLSELPWAEMAASPLPAWASALYYSFLTFLTLRGPSVLLRRSRVAASAILVVLLLGLFLQALEAPRGELEVVFLDVGNGDAAFIRFPSGRIALVDTGPGGEGYSAVRPFLLHRGVRRVDYLFISHHHDDHVGGRVWECFDIGQIFGPPAPGRAKPPGYRPLTAGQRVPIDPAVGVEVLSPAGPVEDENDNSMVLLVTFGRTAFLFTGDAGREVEEGLPLGGLADKKTVLKVAHHGSSTSTSDAFLERMRPVAAVISVGERNPHGLPDREVLERLDGMGAAVFRTDRDGAVTVRSNGSGLRWFTFRNGGGSFVFRKPVLQVLGGFLYKDLR